MAANTDPRLQNQVIYSIYVRNHTSEGTFRAVIPDLDRIRALGTDIIWLMPIHPIGVEGKKGTLGCPYANRDYRAVNPAYGTMEDFEALVRAPRCRHRGGDGCGLQPHLARLCSLPRASGILLPRARRQAGQQAR